MKSSMTYKSEIPTLVRTVSMAAIFALTASFSAFAETGITSDKIIIGGVMDLAASLAQSCVGELAGSKACTSIDSGSRKRVRKPRSIPP